jgi:DNA-binding response OmpR family regulator
MKILIIEDEKELTDSILQYLHNEGYICETAYTYNAALEKISLYHYNIVIVDINLPDGTGLNIIKKLKGDNYEGGIIIISGRSSLDDRVAGLNFGADDYLVKPFFLPELNARIKSLIRRVNFKGSNSTVFNELRIDNYEHQVFVNESPLDLTKTEYDLLLFLFTNKGRVISKESIAEHLWGDYIDMSDSFDFVYAHIKNLRKKMAEKGAANYIQTVYGVGYKFSAA